MKTFAKIKSGAFTLIELLAAMTITTVLVLVIVALTSRGGRYLEMGAAGCADHDACSHGHGYPDQGF